MVFRGKNIFSVKNLYLETKYSETKYDKNC